MQVCHDSIVKISCLFMISIKCYTERIADQKLAVKILVTLYSHSSEMPGRADTLKDRDATQKPAAAVPRKFFKKALKGVRVAATTTTTALGNVASEIAGR